MNRRVFVGNNGIQIGSVIVPSMSLCVVIPQSKKIFEEFRDALCVVTREHREFFMSADTMQPVYELYVETLKGKLDTIIAREHITLLNNMWDFLDDRTYKFATQTISSNRAMGVDLLLLSFQNLNALCRSRRFADEKHIKNCYISLHPVHNDKSDLSGILTSSESESANVVNYMLTYSTLTILDVVTKFYKLFQRGEQ